MNSRSVRTYTTQKYLTFKRNRDNRKCKGEESPHVKLKTGTFVQDKYPNEEIKLIEIPLKKSHLSLNISDESYESMGDIVGDTLDEKHEKVLEGKEAADKLKELQSTNTSHQTT